MNTKIRLLIFFIVIGAAGVFAYTLMQALWYVPSQEAPAPGLAKTAPAAKIAKSAQPARLSIPSLGIDASVQQTGINAKGNMGVPTNFTDVAWYKYGTVPGYDGSAVIDGHVDNGLALAGVFKHLDEIKTGDDVFVTTKGGDKLHFVVTDVEDYPYNDVPLSQVFSKSDGARLNLITCDGGWVSSGKTYDHRLVVYTELVS